MGFSATFLYRVQDKYSPKLKAMRSATDSFRLRLMYAGSSLEKFGIKASKASTALANLRTGFAAAMLTRGLMRTSDEALNFSTAMFKAEAWTDGTKKQMKMLGDEAMRLNKETKFTALNVAESMGLLARRDISPEDIKTLVPTIAALATAGGDTTMPQITDALANALAVYDAGADKAVEFADKMASASSGSAYSMLQLIDAFNAGGGTAESMGAKYEEVLAVLGAASEKGEVGARAGTRLGMSLLYLPNPTNKALKALQKLKIGYDDVFDVKGNIKIIDLVEQLEKGSAGMGKAERGGYLEEIFSRRGARFMMKVVGQSELIRKKLKKIYEDEGAADKISRKMQQGITKATAEASSSWLNMVTAIGLSLHFITIPLLKIIKKFADWVKDSPGVARTVGLFMAISAVFLIMVTTLGMILAAVGSITIAVGMLGMTIGVFFWWVLGISAAIIIIIASTSLLIAYWEKGRLILAFIAAIVAVIVLLLGGPLWIIIIASILIILGHWKEIKNIVFWIGAYLLAMWETPMERLKKFLEMLEDAKNFFTGEVSVRDLDAMKLELSSDMADPESMFYGKNIVVEVNHTGGMEFFNRTGLGMAPTGQGGNVPTNITNITDITGMSADQMFTSKYGTI